MTPATRVDGPLRVALYSGVYPRHDAISHSLRYKLDVLDAIRAGGGAVEATAFTHGTDHVDPRVRVIRRVPDLLRAPGFRSAHIHIFEFGIYYPMFDAVFLVPAGVPTVGVYHNVTPLELADDDPSRATIRRSLVQKNNLSLCDEIVCVSEYNRQDLISFGIEPQRLTVLPLPPARRPPVTPGRKAGQAVRLLYVGRFVRAKGVLDLLEAVVKLVKAGCPPFQLTMAGNTDISSPAVLDEMRRLCRAHKLDPFVQIVRCPDEKTLAGLYDRADAFVMPSYHEGYCVPVVEALSTGCHVIAYDSSNLPAALAGLGCLVPTGDVDALAAALGDYMERRARSKTTGEPFLVRTPDGLIPADEWTARTAAYMESSASSATFEQGFVDLLVRLSGSGQRQLLGAGAR